jgi:hypothetical protein
VARNCGIGSSFLKAEVKKLERLHIARLESFVGRVEMQVVDAPTPFNNDARG